MIYYEIMRKSIPVLLFVLIGLLFVSCATPRADFSKGYNIVVSGKTDMETVNLAKNLASFIGKETGYPVSVGTDLNPETVYEISLGQTNRGYCEEFVAGLRAEDWCYVVSGSHIIIAGSTAETLNEAVLAFKEYLSDNEGALSDVSYYRKGEYGVDSFLLGDVPIYEYTIVVPKMSGEIYRAATFLRNLISYQAGYLLKIDTSASGRAIVIGRDAVDSGPEYSIRSEGNNLIIDGPKYMLMGAVRDFFGSALESEEKDIVLALPASELAAPGNYENGFVLVSSVSSEIRSGITYTVNRYLDADNAPVVAYVLKVDKGAGTLINGTPGGGYELHNVRATTLEAAESAREAGYDVIGAVNADFFRINEDGSPRGTCIKDSVIMQVTDESSRSFFAVLDDGSYFCAAGAPSDEMLPHIVEAVGGGVVLLKNGEIVRSSTKERHPRTVVGYDSNGAAYLVVVDGRQAKISNGAYYGDLSLILKEIGAEEGINLDGGGSSTFLLNENGTFKVKNSPSDGSLRKDYNSLIVVAEHL